MVPAGARLRATSAPTSPATQSIARSMPLPSVNSCRRALRSSSAVQITSLPPRLRMIASCSRRRMTLIVLNRYCCASWSTNFPTLDAAAVCRSQSPSLSLCVDDVGSCGGGIVQAIWNGYEFICRADDLLAPGVPCVDEDYASSDSGTLHARAYGLHNPDAFNARAGWQLRLIAITPAHHVQV